MTLRTAPSLDSAGRPSTTGREEAEEDGYPDAARVVITAVRFWAWTIFVPDPDRGAVIGPFADHDQVADGRVLSRTVLRPRPRAGVDTAAAGRLELLPRISLSERNSTGTNRFSHSSIERTARSLA